jgi:hypothetical protein
MIDFNWLADKIDLPGIYNNLIADSIWTIPALILLAWKYVQRAFALFGMSARDRTLVLIALCSLPLMISLFNSKQLYLYLVTIAIIMVVSVLTVRGYSNVGIVDAYTTTIRGIDYKRALHMSKSSMDFLGIGGEKLTSEAEFDSAMMRCASAGRKVRFLLSPPSNPVLEKIALQNGTSAGAYGEKVRDSVRKIANVCRTKSLDIEVRYYPASHDKDFQLFRLMFINNDLCLWSWTVWGPHMGKENPQVLLKNRDDQSPNSSAYKAFKDHFETLWNDKDTAHHEFKFDANNNLIFPDGFC